MATARQQGSRSTTVVTFPTTKNVNGVLIVINNQDELNYWNSYQNGEIVAINEHNKEIRDRIDKAVKPTLLEQATPIVDGITNIVSGNLLGAVKSVSKDVLSGVNASDARVSQVLKSDAYVSMSNITGGRRGNEEILIRDFEEMNSSYGKPGQPGYIPNEADIIDVPQKTPVATSIPKVVNPVINPVVNPIINPVVNPVVNPAMGYQYGSVQTESVIIPTAIQPEVVPAKTNKRLIIGGLILAFLLIIK